MSFRNFKLLGALAVSGLAMGAMIGVAHAGPIAPAGDLVLRGSVPPEVHTFDNVLDSQEMDEVTKLTERMAPYLVVGDDGLVSLKPATAAQIGVPEWFLANYRIALVESNKVIARGDIKVNPDLTVEVTTKSADLGVKRDAAGGVVDGASQPDGAVPDWYVWRYNTGNIYYNSYQTYNNYRSNYYNLCNSMASYSGSPWMSSNLVYFYSYNQSYMNNSCYNPNGLYYYLPYQQNSCQGSYNPCYGGLGYKPAYNWTRTYTYSNSCRCYNYQYSWQGYWGRY